ncbi:MAG: hypothetical protein ACI3VN_06975 [Candidatus Onthomonas sp.]
MKKMKKLLALLLALAMVLSLAACGTSGTANGNSSDNGSEAADDEDDGAVKTPVEQGAGTDDPYYVSDIERSDETVTLTVYSQVANYSGTLTGWAATLLKDLFNVELNIIPVTDGTWETRVESGDLGDLIIFGDVGEKFQTAVANDLLFEWEDEDLLSTYGSYIEANYQDALERSREAAGDGCLYGIPNQVATEDGIGEFSYAWELRWDLYKELGYPEINTLDDLLQVLIDMKALEPTDDNGNPTYALSLFGDWDGNGPLMFATCLVTMIYGVDHDILKLGTYDYNTNTYTGYLEDGSAYIDSLRFLNQLYQNGLIDPDSMTNTWSEFEAKAKSGGTLFAEQAFMGSEKYNTSDHLNQGKYMASLQPADITSYVDEVSSAGSSYLWAIGADCEYPELVMQMINWLYTPEGAMTFNAGLRGLMWDYDENGNTILTDVGLACQTDGSYDLSGMQWTSPYTGNTYTLDNTYVDGSCQWNSQTISPYVNNTDSVEGETFSKKTWASYIDATMDYDIVSDWQETTGFETQQAYLADQNYTAKPAAANNFIMDEGSTELKLVVEQVSASINKYSWQAIYAASDAEFDSIIETMKSECNAYGYDQILEWYKGQAEILTNTISAN